MGRLIDQERRRQAQEARQRRSARILEAAAYMLERLPYSQVTMESISQRAKVKKGIASMYFGSKEELFLRLASRELDCWFDRLHDRLEASERLDATAEVAGVLAELSGDGRLFPRLLSLLSAVLDQNLEIDAVVPFLRSLRARLELAGAELAARCQLLTSERATGLVRLLLALMAGAQPLASPLGVGAIAMADPSLAAVRVELAEVLPLLVEAFCAGPVHGPTDAG